MRAGQHDHVHPLGIGRGEQSADHACKYGRIIGLAAQLALGGLDQALGFLFGVARGVLLVAIAFFVYQTVITAQDIPMINDSRSAAVFTRFTDRIEEQNPEAALGWITTQYEELVGVCAVPGANDA